MMNYNPKGTTMLPNLCWKCYQILIKELNWL